MHAIISHENVARQAKRERKQATGIYRLEFFFYFLSRREEEESSNIIVCLTPLIAILHSHYILKDIFTVQCAEGEGKAWKKPPISNKFSRYRCCFFFCRVYILRYLFSFSLTSHSVDLFIYSSFTICSITLYVMPCGCNKIPTVDVPQKQALTVSSLMVICSTLRHWRAGWYDHKRQTYTHTKSDKI